jgi:ATP-dependent DNA helicase RecG
MKTPEDIGETARDRMQIMTATTDGFRIAEEDLRLRGWGDFFGTRQHGMPDFKLANPVTDRELLQECRQDAFMIVQKDPALRKASNRPVYRYIRDNYADRIPLSKIG